MTPRVNRRTKIVATVGPASESADMIARLIAAGVNVFRLNFSHGTSEQHARVAQRIRKQASIAGQYVGILADLQGPKIRISTFRQESVELAQGDRFRLDLNLGEGEGDARGVGLDYRELCDSVARGDTDSSSGGRDGFPQDMFHPRAATGSKSCRCLQSNRRPDGGERPWMCRRQTEHGLWLRHPDVSPALA